jgi:DNA polymerase-1
VKSLYVVDGHSHIFRAYHAVGYLSTSKGVPSHAVLILSSMLWKLIREEKPDYLGITLDPPGPTFRETMFADYAATRTSMPDDLARQLPYVRRLFEALRTPVVEIPGFEADDVLATRRAGAEAAGPRDRRGERRQGPAAAGGPRVRVLSVLGRTGERVMYDEAKVRERWGVEPAQIADVLALMGDSIDNIPGVKGVGEKTAVKLVSQFGSVDRLYENLPLVGGKLRETLAASRKQAILSRELAVLARSAPVTLDLDAFRLVEPDWPRLRGLWMEMEFTRLIKELPATTVAASAEPVARLESAEALAEYLGACRPACHWLRRPATPARRRHASRPGLFHPAVERLMTSVPATGFGERPLIVHDASPARGLARRGHRPAARGGHRTAAYLLNPARDHRLDEVMESFMECPPARRRRPRPASRRRRRPRPGLAAPGSRGRFIWQIWEMLPRALKEVGLHSLYEDLERPLVPVLAAMERHGIRVEPARLEEFAKELERDLDNLTREIYALAGENFTISSPKQLAQILFEKLKLPAYRRTKTGYSTDADVLTELAVGHPLPGKVLEHRTLSKLKGTYADALPLLVNPSTGRIHTTFNQLVAATGRLSSQDPNLMNIPIRTELGRRIRAAFVPAEGWQFVAADYSQIELRILAHLSGEPAIIESFKRGEDIHTRTACDVFKVAPGEVTSLQRTIAKSANYAILYGVSAFGLSQATKIDQKEAQRYIEAYFATHPLVRAFIDRTLADGRERGYVMTLLGRRRYLPDLRSNNPVARNAAERMAMSAPVQGTASDMIKIAMVRMDAAMRARNLQARMLLQVHDELLFESPPDEVETDSALAREIMEAALPLDVPIVVDLKAGLDWSHT